MLAFPSAPSGAGVSASLGQGTPLIDFPGAKGALPTGLELFGNGAVSLTPSAIAAACADPAECPPELDPCMAPVQVNLTRPPSGKPRRSGVGLNSPHGPTKAKEQRTSRFPPLRSHEVAAERPGFANRGVLSRSPTFLTGVRSSVVTASYGPLDESARLSAVAQRKIIKLKDKGSFELTFSRHVGECWSMD